MRHRERNQVQQNPDIASTTEELKSLHAQPALTPPEANKFKGNRLGHLPLMIGGGALTAAILGGGYFVAKGGDSTPAPDRNRDPVATAPATPGETEASEPSAESEYAPSALSAEQYTTGEELASAFNDERNKWVMSGVDIQDQVDWGNYEESITNIASEYDDKYIETLFVDDWESNSKLYDMIMSYKEQHRNVLNTSIMTTDSTQPEDIEPYKMGQDITSVEVVESTPDQITVNTSIVLWSNADMNRGNLYVDNVDGKEGSSTITYVLEDGTWKISDAEYSAK